MLLTKRLLIGCFQPPPAKRNEMSELLTSPKLMNILYACANGKLPWGVEWDNFIPLVESSDRFDQNDPTEYILCCGHTLLYHTESSEVIGAGLMLPGEPDKFGRPTLTISKAGREHLAKHMDKVTFDA